MSAAPKLPGDSQAEPAPPHTSRLTPHAVADRLGRALGSLRLSVTDRCNMRCRYCMPEDDYVWLPRSSLLTFEELERVTRVFATAGVSKVRLTGGEPLLRQGLPDLVARLHAVPGVVDLALTTNGLLLERHVGALHQAGLHRVTVSLDTLQPDRALAFARTERHGDILAGIRAARATGMPVKTNAVIVRGFNDDELIDLVEFARTVAAEPRFIEYMDVGGATRWSWDQVISQREILQCLAERYGPIEPVASDPTAPAERFRLSDGFTIGIVASTTAPFCRTCDRSRVTADGTWFLCLYASSGVDLREPLRQGASDAELAKLLKETWAERSDRGAEERLNTPERDVLYSIASLRADPHREMHTRGG